MNNPTNNATLSERLRGLRLGAMAAQWERQQAGLDERPVDQRLTELVAAQEAAAADNALVLGRRRAEVHMSQARLGDVWYRPGRGLTKAMVDALASMDWVKAARNLLITGETGRGKTWLASALANAAIGARLKVRYLDVPTLMHRWYEHEQAGGLARFFADISGAHLLVLDRWAQVPIELPSVLRLDQLIQARDARAAIVVVSPTPTEGWVDWLGGSSVAQGITDRLVSRANRIELKGESLR